MSKQARDLLEFIVSLLFIILTGTVGAVISGSLGMFWFSIAGIIVVIGYLYQRRSFYKWIYAFLLVVILLDKFFGLVNLV